MKLLWISVFSVCFYVKALCVAEVATASGKELVISRLNSTDGDIVISYVLEKIYSRIGYNVSFADYPGRESLENANAGITDGENMRRAGLESEYPNLIQLAYPHVDLSFRIYTNREKGFLTTVDSWKNKRIGIEEGVLISEEVTKGLNPSLYSSVGDMFKQLDAGNVDVVIATDLIGGLEVLKNFKGKNIRTHGPALKVVSLFHYLHKRHADLVPVLNKEIELLRKNGELDKLYLDAFKAVREKTGEAQ
ncbi:ABC transporter substrate-binding protein [Kiloniella sp. EL199]|uniref:substrate-binding periplasmic protein n=1 Tax=Kiloniella sp. EL199 TaxID=2107581 RepID=UPI000EA0DD80|nr:transporter substrate-binding domain-containing protein [Kiloniella sp. EL199]